MLFPELSEVSVRQRERLPSDNLRALITENQLASLPLRESDLHSVAGLTSVAERMTAVATEWPSCGIALCMHYNVLIALHRMPTLFEASERLFEDVYMDEALIASAFSEFDPSRAIFSPALQYRPQGAEHMQLHGWKKPCTLGTLANYIVLSCREARPAGEPEADVRVALVPRHEAIRIDPGFYRSDIFGASDTTAIGFEGVSYPLSLLDRTAGDFNAMVLLNYGMSVFNILISACYTGVVHLLQQRLGPAALNDAEVAQAYTRLVMSSDTLIRNMIRTTAEGFTEELVAEVLILRYQLENTILQYCDLLWQRLSSQSVIGDPDVTHLINTCRMMKYHPTTQKRFIASILEQAA